MKSFYLPFAVLISVLFISSCGTPKDTRMSRSMQNLTSKFNILYNANILLDESVRSLDAANPEDYTQLIPVYKEPNEASAQAIATDMDSIITKGKLIIDDKLYSKFVDDAYFLIGKANYYKANFFAAAEFFTYVYNNYPDNKPLRQQALVFQARSLIQLSKLEEARVSIDTALKHIDDSKKTRRYAADVYATAAQYLVETDKEKQAIEMLDKALQSKGVKHHKLRWTYVLAQLQERNQQYDQAYKNYTSIVKSNAPFEMAFNAGLNRITIEDIKSGRNIDKIARLRSLLRDDKNKNFKDQIFYRIGDIYLSRNQTQEAISSYNTAIRLSTTNQNQKGLSYLKIADVYFKNGDYVLAKSYYDSTLLSLSPSFKGYDLIRRKASNLELLASRFKIIGREDTLQTLARMPAADREARVGALVREQAEKAQFLSQGNSTPEVMTAGIDRPEISGTAQEGKFYFNNTSAISQGLTEFKRRWGNRTLEDNWRRSTKSAAEEILNAADNPDAPAGFGTPPATTASLNTPEAIKAYYDTHIPLTDSALATSNQHIAEAYYDIASFYRDELKETDEAISAFEELLKRVPESSYKLAVYYNLYRLYSNVNPQKSDDYKNLLLTKYPESPFAKVITDPEYSKHSSEKDAALNNAYNKIYDLYSQKKYAETLEAIRNAEVQFGTNVLSPQIAYLHSLAIGHKQKLPEFENSLKNIVTTYPTDKLITPLVQQHLLYIANNRALFETRPTALTEINPFEPEIIEPETQQASVVSNIPQVQQRPAAVQPPASNIPTLATTQNTPPASAKPKPVKKPASKQDTVASAIKQQPTTAAIGPATAATAKPLPPAPKPKPLFDLPEVGEYYFVVNVTDPTVNLSSSRFGIGQFNRSRFSNDPIKHQLKAINDEAQLIFVGPFENLESVRFYERNILPLMKDIMKVPAEKYNTFVITKTELDKLSNSAKIGTYLDFYKTAEKQ